jgi:TonB-linked SusC/RagA family outer membrane protein
MNNKYVLVYMLAFVLSFITGEVHGQKNVKYITIQSIVKDINGKAIPGVNVFGKEGAILVQTDVNGKFTISVPEKSDILFEADGFNELTRSASDIFEAIELTKSPFMEGKNDVVNVAFGRVNAKEKVAALSVLHTADVLSVSNMQDVQDAMQGRIPGLMNNGMLRRIGAPLVVVDGIPRDFSSIQTEEIDQITVLKDINASIMYGTQAKNGVVLITTKRGVPNKRKINVLLEQGYSTPVVLPQYLNSAKYMGLYNEALVNDGLTAIYDETQIANYSNGNVYRYPDTDYFSDEFLKSGKPFTSFISEFSGGNKTTKYYANFGWVNSGSILKNGEAKNANTNRLNARANVDIQINDYVKSNIDAVVVFDIDKNINGDFWGYSNSLHPYYFSPLIPVSMIENKNSIETAKLINGKYILGGTTQYMNNVYGDMYFAGYKQRIGKTIQLNNGIDVDLNKIAKGLTLKTSISFDMYNSFVQSVINQYAVYSPVWDSINQSKILDVQKINEDKPMNYQNLSDADYTRNLSVYAMLDYKKTMGNNNITATLLGYYNNSHVNYVVADKKYAHLGFHATYNYAKKYYLDFNSAYIHSVKFAKGNRGAFSPSVGLGWLLSEEDFMKGIDNIDYLKLKFSTGVLNTDIDILNPNQSMIDNYMYESTFVTGNQYGWGDGLRESRSVTVTRQLNPNLTFEKMKDLNVGLEGYLFNNMIGFDANVFHVVNSGIVAQRVTYPAYVSTYIPFENMNENSYSGAELGLNFNKKAGDFDVNVGANLLYAVSRVDLLNEIWSYDYQYRQGEKLNSIFGLKSLGFFADEADIQNSPTQTFGEVKPGDIKYKDQNKDGVIDANDEVMIGNWLPDFTYSAHFNLKYKSLNLFVLGVGQNGGNGMYDSDYFWVDGNDKYSVEVLNRWTPETAQTATYPRLTSKNSSNNYRNSTFWMYKNDYFSISQIQLTYEMPFHVITNLGLKGLNVYLRGSNLLMLAKDAEKRQLVIGGEPNYRNYAAGLKILF